MAQLIEVHSPFTLPTFSPPASDAFANRLRSAGWRHSVAPVFPASGDWHGASNYFQRVGCESRLKRKCQISHSPHGHETSGALRVPPPNLVPHFFFQP